MLVIEFIMFLLVFLNYAIFLAFIVVYSMKLLYNVKDAGSHNHANVTLSWRDANFLSRKMQLSSESKRHAPAWFFCVCFSFNGAPRMP